MTVIDTWACKDTVKDEQHVASKEREQLTTAVADLEYYDVSHFKKVM